MRVALAFSVAAVVATVACGDVSSPAADAGDPDTGTCPDGDGDGYLAAACGGTDCDDSDPAVHPDADESGEDFTIEEIDGNAAEPALAVAGGGVAHVVYAGIELGDLRYATNGPGSWRLETLTDAGVPASHPAAAVGGGVVHLVHRVAADFARARSESGAAWVYEVVYAGGGQLSLAAAEPAGALQVVFLDFDAGTLSWGREPDAGAWAIETVDTFTGDGAGLPMSMALDSGGNPHVLHRMESGELRLAVRDGPWSTEILPFEARASGIALVVDASGRHVAFQPALGGLATVATDGGGEWEIAWEGEASRDIRLAVDGSGAYHVLYRDFGAGNVRYASNAGGEWQEQIVDGVVAAYPSIAVAGGRVHTVFLQDVRNVVAYASRAIPDAVDSDCDGIR